MHLVTHQEQTRLLTAWKKLDQEGQRTVRLFAEFLSQQTDEQAGKPTPTLPQEPLSIPKPEGESAVLALKRLKKSYPMIEADFSLLEDASQMLLKRVMGTADATVVAELEKLFAGRYQAWKNAHSSP